MSNVEKVIKGLEQFIADFKPFCGNEADWKRVFDALALLKAQEPVEPKKLMAKEKNGYRWRFYCGKCGDEIDRLDKYCRHCGRAVKW